MFVIDRWAGLSMASSKTGSSSEVDTFLTLSWELVKIKFSLREYLARWTKANVRRHIICERDVGLFSLIQQVIANVPFAVRQRRIPIVFFQDKTCYWTPNGYRGKDTVWEYYFEPIFAGHPASSIPRHIRRTISTKFPSPFEAGYFEGENTFISNNFGDHHRLRNQALAIPYLLDDPDDGLRLDASEIIRDYVRPRDYINRKVDDFFAEYMNEEFVIGVHVRGTDAVSRREVRPHRRGSLDISRYVAELKGQLEVEPAAKIFVATDAKASLDHIKNSFANRVFAYDSIRHEGGESAGAGPTGWIMPAYVAADRDQAARNGEEAIIEYLLLSRCRLLVHNGSSLARTALLKSPRMPHINTHKLGRRRGGFRQVPS